MASYEVRIVPAARRQLRQLSKPAQQRVRLAIRGLSNEPRPANARLLAGDARRTWRLRVGDYRVLYEIHYLKLVVLVIRIGHRRDVYR